MNNLNFRTGTHDRVDGRLKVTGRAMYSGDHPVPNLCFGYLIQSRIARGKIRSIDTAPARGIPGVVGVFTPFESFKLYKPLDRSEGVISGDAIALLQDTEIHYYGQTIGLVVAETFEAARDAAGLIRPDYEAATPMINLERGIDRAVLGRQAEVADFSLYEDGVTSFDSVMAATPVKHTARYSTPIEHHNPMEPHATIAVWDGDRLTVYDATQWVMGVKKNLAAVLGIDDDQVRVICPFVGGAFGCKGSMWMHTPLTAAAARVLNRPVKTVLARDQMYTAVGHRPALIQDIDLAANSDGTLRGLRHVVHSITSKTKEFVEPAAHRTSRFLYKAPNLVVNHRLVPLDVAPGTFMRAPGECPGSYALESAMDELAIKLNLDPIELRLRNYAEIYPGKNIPWSSKHLRECYLTGAERFSWASRNQNPGQHREGDWLIGQGMAGALYPAHRSKGAAKVRLQADGLVTVSSATHDLGTGMYTVLALVTAQALGVPVERIRPMLGDSALPIGPVAGGSQSTASIGPAVYSAAQGAGKKLISLAVKEKSLPFHGLPENEVVVADGQIKARGESMPFEKVLQTLGRSAIDATSTAEPGEEEQKYAFHSFGAQFCEVRVNRSTGEVRIGRFTSVMDIGTVVNQKAARSQIIGGIVFGIGMALLEATQVDQNTGYIANRNISDYLVPTNADVPYIDVHFLDYPDTIFNSLGVRGCGEIGITGTAAAVVNAIYNATGKRIRELPVSPEKILV